MTTGIPPIADLAEALVTEFKDFGVPARRAYRPYLKREEMGSELHVLVMLESERMSIRDRGGNRTDPVITVLIQKAVDPEDIRDVDACLFVVTQIKNLYDDPDENDSPNAGELRDKTLAGHQWMGLDQELLFLPHKLIEDQQFTSIIEITYSR